MILFYLTIPAFIIFFVSFFEIDKAKKILPYSSFLVLLPIIYLFLVDKPYNLIGDYMIATKLNTYVLLVSSIVAIGVILSLITLDKRVKISKKGYIQFYRFFATFWLGLTVSILSNNMGIYWIGLELATLSTVYMIKTNLSKRSISEAWNYMIVGTIAISLVLFGIILIYASAKPVLAEDAMNFQLLLENIKYIKSKTLFEIGFLMVSLGMFIKMGFFPMSLWLANIERASYYPIAALFSGILESAILVGFFNFSSLAMKINPSGVFAFVFIYAFLTLFIITFLLFKAKDFIRLFSLSGIEHMVIITLFWVSGAHFAALLHFGAHAFLKPALFLSSGILEFKKKYNFAGTLKGFGGFYGNLFYYLVGFLILAVISLPPSPMFFSEIYGISAIFSIALKSKYMLLVLTFVLLFLFLLSIIFYKFIQVYQSMKYEGEEVEKVVYVNEILSICIFALATLSLLSPLAFNYLKGIYE